MQKPVSSSLPLCQVFARVSMWKTGQDPAVQVDRQDCIEPNGNRKLRKGESRIGWSHERRNGISLHHEGWVELSRQRREGEYSG